MVSRVTTGDSMAFSTSITSLIEFVEIVEKESRYYATKLADIRLGIENIPKYAEKTIPIIPDEYTDFKQNM